MKKLMLTVGVAVASALLGEIADLPLQVPCGQLTDFIKKEDPQRFVDFERAAEKADDKPAVTAPEELIVEREPENGMVYAIFTFKVAAGRTLSKYDYILETDAGATQPCLEIGRAAGDFYDLRIRNAEGPEIYKLIFYCPKEAYEVRLRYAFPKLPLPPIGDFVINPRPAPPPAPEPAAPAATPEGAAPAATTDGAAPAPAAAAPAPAPAAAAPAPAAAAPAPAAAAPAP